MIRRLLALLLLSILFTPPGFCADPPPETPAPNTVAQAYQLLQTREYDKAILSAVRALIADSGQPLTDPAVRKKVVRDLLIMAWCFSGDQNDRACQQTLQTAHELSPENTLVTAMLVSALPNHMDSQKEELYKQLLPAADKDPVAACSIGEHLLRQDKVVEGRKMFERAVALAPENPLGHCSLGRWHNDYGDSKTAAKEYRLAAKYEPSAYQAALFEANADILEDKSPYQHLIAAGKMAPDDPSWHTRIAYWYDGQKNVKQCDAEFERATHCRRVSTRSFNQLAYHLISAGNGDEAHRCLDYLERLRPQSSEVHLTRANILNFWQKKYADSIPEYEKGIAINPDNPWLYIYQAEAWESLKKPPEEIAVMKRLIARHPENHFAQRYLGDACKHAGDWKTARAAYSKARTLASAHFTDPSKSELAAQTSGIGYCLYKSGDPKGAQTEAIAFNKIKEIEPTPATMQFLGIRFRPDRLSFDHAPTSLEFKVAALIAIADLLFEVRDFTAASEEYRKAIELQPDNVELHMYLFSTLAQKGDWPAAMQEDIILANKMVGSAPKKIAEWKKKFSGGK